MGRYSQYAEQPAQQSAVGGRGRYARFAGSQDVSGGDAFLYNAADAASFGLGDEGVGLFEGASAALRGGSFADTYHERVSAARDRLRRAREDQPGWSFAGSAVGSLASIPIGGVVGGAARAGRLGGHLAGLMRSASGRGLNALRAQGQLGAYTGAVTGAAYGAASGEDFESRIGNVLPYAGFGAAAGGLLPVPVQGALSRQIPQRVLGGGTLGAVGGALTNPDDPLAGAFVGAGVGAGVAGAGVPAVRSYMDAAARAARSRTPAAMSLIPGAPPMGGGGPRGPSIRPSTLKTADRLLGEAGDDLEGLTSRFQRGRDAGVPDARAIDVADPEDLPLAGPFETYVDAAANTTREARADVARLGAARAKNLPGDLKRGIQEMEIDTSPEEALQNIRDMRQNNGEYGYERILRDPDGNPVPVGQQQVENLNFIMGRDPIFQRALAGMRDSDARQWQAAQNAARASGQPPTQGPPRPSVIERDGVLRLAPGVSRSRLHRLKMAVDDELNLGQNPMSQSPIRKSEWLEDLEPLHRQFMREIDNAIPGYENARATAGGLFEAEEALAAAKGWVNKSSDELRTLVSRNPRGNRAATPFEQKMYRTVFARHLLDKIERRASTARNKMKNVSEAFDSEFIQNQIRTVFGTKDADAVARFLERTILQGEMLRRASGWVGNSKTAMRASGGAGQFLAAASRLLRGDMAGVADDVAKTAWTERALRATEAENADFVKTFLRKLDSPEDYAVMEELLRMLRVMRDERVARAANAPIEGVGGALGGGSLTDD